MWAPERSAGNGVVDGVAVDATRTRCCFVTEAHLGGCRCAPAIHPAAASSDGFRACATHRLDRPLSLHVDLLGTIGHPYAVKAFACDLARPLRRLQPRNLCPARIPTTPSAPPQRRARRRFRRRPHPEVSAGARFDAHASSTSAWMSLGWGRSAKGPHRLPAHLLPPLLTSSVSPVAKRRCDGAGFIGGRGCSVVGSRNTLR